MIAIGPDPHQLARELVYVMYGAGGGLRVRVSTDGGATFGRAVTAVAGGHGNAAIGGDGRLHLVALDAPAGGYGSAQHQIVYTVSADGGATLTTADHGQRARRADPRVLREPDARGRRQARLDLRRVRARRRARRWDLVIASTKDAGKTWTRTRIGDDCALHMVPNLALDPTTGTLHVAWYDSEGGGRFAHATCIPGTCTLQGAIATVPFAALSTGRYGASWVGDYESLVIDDKRRILHAVWAEPVSEGATVVSRIFHAQAKLPKR